eukprot:2531460-Amphidinium_carterae.1
MILRSSEALLAWSNEAWEADYSSHMGPSCSSKKGKVVHAIFVSLLLSKGGSQETFFSFMAAFHLRTTLVVAIIFAPTCWSAGFNFGTVWLEQPCQISDTFVTCHGCAFVKPSFTGLQERLKTTSVPSPPPMFTLSKRKSDEKL